MAASDSLYPLTLPSEPAHSSWYKMQAIQTHPSNAAQAKAFTAPGSLSFPSGHQELTPPTDGMNAQRPAANGAFQQGSQMNGTGVVPNTPAATPAAATVGSGLTPTLQ
jgi:transcription initiation factor TFIID TATA-box-binding protein